MGTILPVSPDYLSLSFDKLHVRFSLLAFAGLSSDEPQLLSFLPAARGLSLSSDKQFLSLQAD